MHLFNAADSDGNGVVDFEEYLMWCLNHAWAEELLVTDPKERELRKIARDRGFNLPEVEKVKRVFDRFDTDGGGVIDEQEFRKVITELMRVQDSDDLTQRKLVQLWKGVDTDGNGQVKFEEFLVWYLNLH